MIVVEGFYSLAQRDVTMSCRINVMSFVSRWPVDMSVEGVYKELCYEFELLFYRLNCDRCEGVGYVFRDEEEMSHCFHVCPYRGGTPGDFFCSPRKLGNYVLLFMLLIN